ncbi:hypothetical protein CC79DRAFT_1384893 [Sarocladium strictum]
MPRASHQSSQALSTDDITEEKERAYKKINALTQKIEQLKGQASDAENQYKAIKRANDSKRKAGVRPLPQESEKESELNRDLLWLGNEVNSREAERKALRTQMKAWV